MMGVENNHEITMIEMEHQRELNICTFVAIYNESESDVMIQFLLLLLYNKIAPKIQYNVKIYRNEKYRRS